MKRDKIETDKADGVTREDEECTLKCTIQAR